MTAKELKRTTQIVKLNKLREKDKSSPVPNINTIVRITSNPDPDKPSVKGYWGVVVKTGEFSCDARVLQYFSFKDLTETFTHEVSIYSNPFSNFQS